MKCSMCGRETPRCYSCGKEDCTEELQTCKDCCQHQYADLLDKLDESEKNML